MEGMIKRHLGLADGARWKPKPLRVSDRVLLLITRSPTSTALWSPGPIPRKECDVSCGATAAGSHLPHRPGRYSRDPRPDSRSAVARPGIGDRLVGRLCDRYYGCIYTFVPADDVVTHAFYHSLDFEPTPVPGFYHGRDAVLFTRKNLTGEDPD